MSALSFVPLDETHYTEFRRWFENQELQRRISPPTDSWFSYVRETPNVYAWLIYDGAQAVGEVQLDIEVSKSVETGHVAVVVNPELWNQGWCKHILQALLDRPELTALTCVEAHVEDDNVASRRCIESVGFVQSNTVTEEGMLLYTYCNSAR